MQLIVIDGQDGPPFFFFCLGTVTGEPRQAWIPFASPTLIARPRFASILDPLGHEGYRRTFLSAPYGSPMEARLNFEEDRTLLPRGAKATAVTRYRVAIILN